MKIVYNNTEYGPRDIEALEKMNKNQAETIRQLKERIACLQVLLVTSRGYVTR